MPKVSSTEEERTAIFSAVAPSAVEYADSLFATEAFDVSPMAAFALGRFASWFSAVQDGRVMRSGSVGRPSSIDAAKA